MWSQYALITFTSSQDVGDGVTVADIWSQAAASLSLRIVEYADTVLPTRENQAEG